ncbi:hypothetical protein A2U01_0061666, partial [Trifolium medium]|nr:hypothetical protein [Trifolium medium]
MDEDISGDSEFVGDTQLVIDAQQQLSTSVIQVPDTVQKDIDFLKESWANMAELEDGNILEQQPEVRFQTVLSRSQKKAIKKRAAAAK